MTYEQELLQKVHKLNQEQKRQVLSFVDGLTKELQGTPGKLAVQYAREIGFTAEDLEQMQRAIEEACEDIEDFPDVDLDG